MRNIRPFSFESPSIIHSVKTNVLDRSIMAAQLVSLTMINVCEAIIQKFTLQHEILFNRNVHHLMPALAES